jgi:AbrB family looped-hinge helix DNA binding protein
MPEMGAKESSVLMLPFFMGDRTCGKRIGCKDREQGADTQNVIIKFLDILQTYVIFVYMSESVTFRENDITKQNVKSKLNDNGRIVIPAEIRSKMGIKPGDTLFLTLEGDVLKVESQMARIRRIQESMRALIPGDRLLSDELIADRREEARREMEEWLG